MKKEPQEVTSYKTSDGYTFDDIKVARDHEFNLQVDYLQYVKGHIKNLLEEAGDDLDAITKTIMEDEELAEMLMKIDRDELDMI